LADYSEFRCPWTSKKELWQTVDAFSNQYCPEKTIPVNMEEIVEKKLGLNIEPMHSLLEELDMDAFLKLDLTGVVVDHDCYMDERFQNRLRFSFAHEVGHFVLHRHIYKELPFSTPEEWRDFVLKLSEKEYGNFEWQANEFAGRLLVPREKLILELEKLGKVLKANGLVSYLKDDADAVLSRISPSFCKPFGVSEGVFGTRVVREGLWPPEL
jgi:hypothetical protein